MITIIDYGMGNIGSIYNMLRKIGVNARVSNKVEDIESASKLILPGVGAFDKGIENLNALELTPALEEKVLNKQTPFLGICVGMQLICKGSEEGKLPGLGWIDAECMRFNFEGEKNLKVPHMGWNVVFPRNNSKLFQNYEGEIRYYFVHSYFVKCKNSDIICGETQYGERFTCAIQKDNIFGVQFHPEKSHRFGMQLLKNFSHD